MKLWMSSVPAAVMTAASSPLLSKAMQDTPFFVYATGDCGCLNPAGILKVPTCAPGAGVSQPLHGLKMGGIISGVPCVFTWLYCLHEELRSAALAAAGPLHAPSCLACRCLLGGRGNPLKTEWKLSQCRQI